MYTQCQPAEQLPAWSGCRIFLIGNVMGEGVRNGANGDGLIHQRQESRQPAGTSGDPSSQTWGRWRWNTVETQCQWTEDHGQWSLRIIWWSSEEGLWQVQTRDSQQNNVYLSTLFDVQKSSNDYSLLSLAQPRKVAYKNQTNQVFPALCWTQFVSIQHLQCCV